VINLFLIGSLLIILSILYSLLDKTPKGKYLSLLNGIGIALCIIPAGYVMLYDTVLTLSFNIYPYGEIWLNIDNLSAFFMIITGIMGFISILYSKKYLLAYQKSIYYLKIHKALISLMICSMLWVLTVQNVLLFLIVWELMSLSSLFLIIFEHNKKEVLKIALEYFIIMHISVLFLLSGFVIAVLNSNNNLNFADLNISIINEKLKYIITILLSIGFAIKAGFLPFHIWLPKAHPAAPSHISGLMSAVMIKIGIYGIFRTFLVFGLPQLNFIIGLLTLSLLSCLWGIAQAILQSDIKKILAYSSIENIGIIGLGMSLGLLGLYLNNPIIAILGFGGSFFHILNHSIYKSLLFYCIGNVYLYTHTRNIEKLGALLKKMPYTGFLFIIGAIAICGLPPFNGFISEILIYMGLFKGISMHSINYSFIMLISIISLALVGVLSIFAFTRLLSNIFLGNHRIEQHNNQKSEQTPRELFILLFFILIISLFPHKSYLFVSKPVSMFIKDAYSINVYTLLQHLSYHLLFFTGLCILIISLRYLLNKKRLIANSETWSCGYRLSKQNPYLTIIENNQEQSASKVLLNGRFQYTGHSLAKSFYSLIFPFIKKKENKKEIIDLFPQDTTYHREYCDNYDSLITNIHKFFSQLFNKFYIKSTNQIQGYLIYAVLFIALTIIITALYTFIKT